MNEFDRDELSVDGEDELQRIMQAYDESPYTSLPFAYTSPSNTAAIALLHGVRAASVENCRVLELGCAGGGNLVPMAALFPRATFTGIDLSKKQIDAAVALAAGVGLTNVTFLQGDLSQVVLPLPEYDYIICHGVFSWVPRKIQDAIFRICEKSLAENGLASISYNVLPGWYLRQMARHLCLSFSSGRLSVIDNVKCTKDRLQELRRELKGSDLYSSVVRAECERIAQSDVTYVAGEYLSEFNSPLSITDFCSRAEQFGLVYVSDAHLREAKTEFMCPDSSVFIKNVADEHPIREQEMIDFVTGRAFRRSIIAKGVQEPRYKPDNLLEVVKNLHFASRLVPVRHPTSAGTKAFQTSIGTVLTPSNMEVEYMMDVLSRNYPSHTSFVDLLRVPDSSESSKLVSSTLYGLWGRGLATASSCAIPSGTHRDRMPKIWGFAMHQIRTGQTVLTGQLLNSVPVQEGLENFMLSVDGTRTVQQLEATARSLIQNPQAKSQILGKLDPKRLVENFLAWASLNALLENRDDPSS